MSDRIYLSIAATQQWAHGIIVSKSKDSVAEELEPTRFPSKPILGTRIAVMGGLGGLQIVDIIDIETYEPWKEGWVDL